VVAGGGDALQFAFRPGGGKEAGDGEMECCAKGRARQNTPKETPSARYIRVIHPHHPLVGQIVRVVSQARHPTYSERQWVVELADRSRASIPLSWAVPVEETEAVISESQAKGLRVDVPALLKLVKMVQYLTESRSEEVLPHEASPRSRDSPKDPQAAAGSFLSRLGTAAEQVPARAHNDAGDNSGQTTASLPGSARGGEA